MKNFEEIVAIDECRPQIKLKVEYLMKIIDLPEKPVGLVVLVQKHSFIRGWMNRYLRLNVESRVIERYRKERHVPFKPCEIIPLKNIKNMKIDEVNENLQSEYVFIRFDYDDDTHEYRLKAAVG